jgi:hypothetical protein
MVDSSQEGEALAAIRQARRLLEESGLSLSELLDLAASPLRALDTARGPAAERPSVSMDSRIRFLEITLERRDAEIRRLREELSNHERLYRERIGKLERAAAEEVEGLQRTVKVLNERLSRVVHDTAAVHRRPDPQDLALEYLRDPARARLSDADIARRVGLSPHRIAILRERLRNDQP